MVKKKKHSQSKINFGTQMNRPATCLELYIKLSPNQRIYFKNMFGNPYNMFNKCISYLHQPYTWWIHGTPRQRNIFYSMIPENYYRIYYTKY